jgi:hypothetical protein
MTYEYKGYIIVWNPGSPAAVRVYRAGVLCVQASNLDMARKWIDDPSRHILCEGMRERPEAS